MIRPLRNSSRITAPVRPVTTRPMARRTIDTMPTISAARNDAAPQPVMRCSGRDVKAVMLESAYLMSSHVDHFDSPAARSRTS